MQGIYEIRNTVTGDCYIGSSRNIGKRWYGHKNQLQRGKHPSKQLQRDWNTYGETAFQFTVLEELVDESLLLAREQYHIQQTSATYNQAPIVSTVVRSRKRPALKPFHVPGYTPVEEACQRWGKSRQWWYNQFRLKRIQFYDVASRRFAYVKDEEVEKFFATAIPRPPKNTEVG